VEILNVEVESIALGQGMVIAT